MATPAADKASVTLKGFAAKRPGSSALRASSVGVRVELRPSTARAAGLEAAAAQIGADDVLELEFEDGARVWMHGDEYRRRFAPKTVRAGAGDGELEVPATLAFGPETAATRGAVGWALKALRVLDIELPADLASGAADLAARKIGEHFDKGPRKDRPGLGLYRCAMASGAFSLSPPSEPLPTDKPLLVFLHGTFSTTWGSFGDLWAPERREALAALRGRYGEHVYGFEHATLSASPVANALALVEKLPNGATLHLVSHSRGGLVGELLCRASRADGKEPFIAEELALFDGEGDHKKLRAELEAFNELLRDKKPKVERFVRVACPALGTTLASKRFDRWLSVVGTLAGTALEATPLADFFEALSEFAAAVLKRRLDPALLPGLAALLPDSPFIAAVNSEQAEVAGDLRVISGDVEGGAWWSKLLVLATDFFYAGDHDLVVNTPSMRGGAKRAQTALESFHQGSGVNHFNYFSDPESVGALRRALLESVPAGFEPLRKAAPPVARAVARGPSGPRPIVVVLPGIMGSHLSLNGDRVWFDFFDLVGGGLRKLAIDAPNITATEPFPDYYGALIDYLQDSHEVVPFPYDWRLAPEREADRLAEVVRQALVEAEAQDQPVRIVAHAMGGLVARSMIARHVDLWTRITGHRGGRLVMLGTPNGGSHAITELLTGQSTTLRHLELIDVSHDTRELLEIIARFPGVLAMLPRDPHENFFARETWQRYYADYTQGWKPWGDVDWVVPKEEDLGGARQFRDFFDRAPLDPAHMIYVAGCARATLSRMLLDPNAEAPENRIYFEATARGDGRVTWDSGIPPGIPTWYMDADHGNLSATEEYFPALAELLERGETSGLSKEPPVSRAADRPFVVARASVEFRPDSASLAAEAIGAAPRPRRARKPAVPRARVTVSHGEVSFASYPVAVGHYAGDTIVSAEAALDRAVDGRLRRIHQTGLYPSAIETCEVVLKRRTNDRLAGAIVVGLGKVGELTPGKLTRSVTRAMLRYVLAASDEASARSPRDAVAPARQGISLSSVLIGTGAGGLTLTDSLHAVLTGVLEANRTLATANERIYVDKVEVLELWEDLAIQAQLALGRLKDDAELARAFEFGDTVKSLRGGRRRASFEESRGWWQRLQITGLDEQGNELEKLRFTAMTRRARSEVLELGTQRRLVDRFVEQLITSTEDNREAARTLFELLLPNDVKDQAPDRESVVLVVDDIAARYPWELIEDRWSDSGRPVCVDRGLLRQLATAEYRAVVRTSVRDDALVIGDPLSKEVPLKGAQQEAEAVAATLRGRGFNVEHLDRPASTGVIRALYAKAYRVLHLAGHGIYREIVEEDPRGESGGTGADRKTEPEAATRKRAVKVRAGMVIGDDALLTPAEVEQMRQVPELVFINCCFLGYIARDPSLAGKSADRLGVNRLAANVAAQFIRMGVRAVIAAGWPVDDAAARTFAAVFYDRMLDGYAFGAAVQEARKATFEAHPRTNTWGAYQCYGDPDYVLPRGRARLADGDEQPLVSLEHARAKIEYLAQSAQTLYGEELARLGDRLRALRSKIESRGWLKQGRMQLALAHAFGDVEDFAAAVDHYRAALALADSACRLKDLEQLANLQVRAAAREFLAQPGAEAESRALAEIDSAIRLLVLLARTPEVAAVARGAGNPAETVELAPAPALANEAGATPERLRLIAAAYRRRALVSEQRRVESLTAMRDWYKAAADKAKDTGEKQADPLLNWLAGEVCLRWYGQATSASEAALRERAKEARDELEARQAPDWGADFWVAVGLADYALTDALLGGASTPDEIDKRYREAWQYGSPRELASVRDHVEFLLRMAESAPGEDERRRREIALLTRIGDGLAKAAKQR